MVARMLPQRLWVISSVGRASRLHREGRQFEPVITHQTTKKKPGKFRAFLFKLILISFLSHLQQQTR